MTRTLGFGLGVDDGRTVTVGLDPSLTSFGVSVVDVTDPEQHATVVFASDLRGTARLLEIAAWLTDYLAAVVQVHPVAETALEGPAYASQRAVDLGELAGIVKTTLARHILYPLVVAPGSLKLWATGSGKASKAQMRQALDLRYGVALRQNDAVDAYWLASWARENAGSGRRSA